jgi:hypothetical protein
MLEESERAGHRLAVATGKAARGLDRALQVERHRRAIRGDALRR